jgi:hypothetical protein
MTRQETKARPAWMPTAEQKARADLSVEPGLSVLSLAAPETLLAAIKRLTHLIHDAHESETLRRALPDLRAQRDLVEAECLRRMGGE